MVEEASLEKFDETKDEASDELLKDVPADNASGHDLKWLAKEAGLEEGDETECNIPEEMPRTCPRADADCDPELEDGEDPELPQKLTKAGLEKEAGLEEMLRDTAAQEDVTTARALSRTCPGVKKVKDT